MYQIFAYWVKYLFPVVVPALALSGVPYGNYPTSGRKIHEASGWVMEIRTHASVSKAILKTRIELAEGFIANVLLSRVDSLHLIEEDELAKLIVDYCRQEGSPTKFETNVLVGRFLDHIQQFSPKFVTNGSKPPDDLVAEYKIFRWLKDKDLRRVDEAIDEL